MNKPLAAVALVGPWKSEDSVENSFKATKVILDEAYKFSEEKYGNGNYYWVTTSIDYGFGRNVLHYCLKQKIKLIAIDAVMASIPGSSTEVRIPFGSQLDVATIFKSRHAAIMELADCFFIKLTGKYTLTEDLVDRVNAADKPYTLYNEENIAIAYKGDPKQNAQRQTER